MKVYVDTDEYYPMFTVDARRRWPGDKELEMTPEEYADYERVSGEFFDWQERIKELFGWLS